ncbi:acyl-CoA dehydrogenase family protein [Patulibacter minatonensis]|uniref:acyl-CoA dehydrogenase family protein n=1 Tax=Patulibacter minatonensis TaxID=298163 RepID=UPI0004799077|nr:acyl-CoA dehydrogenase family protein [Patulibacter minatonensis]
MNLDLTDEQRLLRGSARDLLAGRGTIAAAREAITDPTKLPDLWSVAGEMGWAGLLVSEDHDGVGLSAFDAMLVFTELGRVLASVPLLGHLTASVLADRADGALAAVLADGTRRAAFVAARPPGDVVDGWTVERETGTGRVPAPVLAADGTLTGATAWVPDAPGADVLIVAATREDGSPVVVVVEAGDASVREERTYDATRSVGHLTFDHSSARELDGLGAGDLAGAWYLAQSLLAAEALGAVETALEMAVTYAKDRMTFGRQIGSYQAVKHQLVDVLKARENAYSLIVYAGLAHQDLPEELALAASAARAGAGKALDLASRTCIAVHGGIGATWEHDAPLIFRRAQISRRLLGGTDDATDRVAERVLAGATT